MNDTARHSRVRRGFLRLIPAALATRYLSAEQAAGGRQGQVPVPEGATEELRLPNGKLQRDAILQADYKSNLKDARELIDLSTSFELDLEKSDANVLSLNLLKKLDDMDKITKRIRGRMRH